MMEITAFVSNIVTVIGLPIGIAAFWIQRNKERENEEAMIYQSLSSSYDEFLKLVLANADLQLWSKTGTLHLDDEQKDRLIVLFELLTSLFERAYILSYSDEMTKEQQRRWLPWENYMRHWCLRDEYRSMLPGLLDGDDPKFTSYILTLARTVEEVNRAPGGTIRDEVKLG